MGDYTKEDLEYLWNEHNTILKQIRTATPDEITSKKEKILRYQEIVIKLVDAGAIAIEGKQITKKDVANYCYKKLIDDCGFTYHKSSFYELFTDDYKRNYSQSAVSALSNHEHEFELVDILPDIGEIKRCECGQMMINGKLVKLESVSADEEEETETKAAPEPANERREPKDNLEKLLLLRGYNASLISKIWTRMYAASAEELVKLELDNLFSDRDVEELLNFEQIIATKLKVIDEQTDKRERLHFAETMRLYMYNEFYGMKKCGDILEYSSKWVSIIARQEQNKNLTDEQKLQKVEEIKQKIADCPVCGWEGFGSWLNEQKNRIDQGLDPEMPQNTGKYIKSQIMKQLGELESETRILKELSEAKVKENIILTQTAKDKTRSH